MRVENTTFHFAGHENLAQGNKSAKEAISILSEHPVRVSISKEGYASYRNSVQENGQSLSYDEMIKQRKMLEEAKDSNINLGINYSGMLAAEAYRLNDEDKKAITDGGGLSWRAKAENYAEAYANLYEEIVQGYANGTRKVNVQDENSELGYRTLTMEEELSELDKAYVKNVEFFEEATKNELETRKIIEETAEKIASATNGRYSGRFNAYLRQHDGEQEQLPDNLAEKLLAVRDSWKEAYSISGKNEAFRSAIVQNGIETLNHLPAYSGMYEADKTIAAALENSTKEEQAFVYDIIRQNFLIGNSGSMTEEERQANIALGMKKAEYAAENFISEDDREAFLEAMENIAKLASAGKIDSSGNIDYGVNKAKYLGHGSDIVYTTNTDDMMRQMDSAAYEEYKKLSGKDSLKYLMNWYEDALKKNPNIVDEYEQKSEKYVEENVKNKKLDTTFADIKTDSKEAFLESLRIFQLKNPGFLSAIIDRELSLQFWN